MKTIIFCGGLGSRLREETEFKPKPMVTVGGMPIVWHIMKHYSHFGHNEFILTLGYKGKMIREYFTKNNKDKFKITFADTGLKSMTGERMLRSRPYITEDEFMLTYGDGVTDLNINKLIKFHHKQNTIATMSGVHPQSKYGVVRIDKRNNLVTSFKQKPLMYDYVSGGFMIFKREALKYFDNGDFENGLIKLAKKGQLSIYRHEGFWKPMDTYLEMEDLNKLWKNGRPWAVWDKNKK